MNNLDRDEFFSIWRGAVKSANRTPPDGEGLIMVFNTLVRYEIEDIKRAVFKHLGNPDNGNFPITPADVVRIIEGDSKSASIKAWTLVELVVIRQQGSGPDIIINDQISMKVIDELGGLAVVCDVSDDELPYMGNRFRDLYQHFRINGADKWPDILKGKDNVQRELFGLEKLKPRMIGYERKDELALPDMSKPRYEQIEKAEKGTAQDAINGIKALLGMVTESNK